MEPFARASGRRFYLVRQEAPEAFAGRLESPLFPCLIWDSVGERTIAERDCVVASLLDTGCRYFVCGGVEARSWEEAADEAFVERMAGLSEADFAARMAMTTSHPGESEDDVAFYFVVNTNFDAHDFRDYLVLVLGSDDDTVERLRAAIRRCLVSEQP